MLVTITCHKSGQRGDSFMAAGNALMVVGAIALLAVTGPLALVAAVAIAVDLVIRLFSFDDAQRWVKDGFWGTSGTYWNDDRDDSITAQIREAKILSNPTGSDYDRIKNFFENELAQYVAINADLKVEVDRIPNGTFDAELTIESTRLW